MDSVNIDKLMVRRHHREGITDDSVGNPLGLAVAKVVNGRIQVGWSLTHPNDHYSKVKANLAAIGRFNSGKYSFSINDFNHEIDSVLPKMVAQRMRDTVEIVLTDAVYRYNKFGAAAQA